MGECRRTNECTTAYVTVKIDYIYNMYIHFSSCNIDIRDTADNIPKKPSHHHHHHIPKPQTPTQLFSFFLWIFLMISTFLRNLIHSDVGRSSNLHHPFANPVTRIRVELVEIDKLGLVGIMPFLACCRRKELFGNGCVSRSKKDLRMEFERFQFMEFIDLVEQHAPSLEWSSKYYDSSILRPQSSIPCKKQTSTTTTQPSRPQIIEAAQPSIKHGEFSFFFTGEVLHETFVDVVFPVRCADDLRWEGARFGTVAEGYPRDRVHETFCVRRTPFKFA